MATAALKLVPGRQQVISAVVTILLANLTDGVDVPVMELPAGAEVIGGAVVTETAFNSTSTDTIDIGDTGSQNRYLNDGNFRAAGARVALVPTGYVNTAPTKLTARWVSGGGSPTTGKCRLRVDYIVIGREQFTQG